MRHPSQRPLDGVVDPAVVVAESTTAHPSEVDRARPAARLYLASRQQRRIVSCVQHQPRKRLPRRRRDRRVGHRKCRAEGLRHDRPTADRPVGDLDAELHPRRQLRVKIVLDGLSGVRQQPSNVLQPVGRGQGIPVAHGPERLHRPAEQAITTIHGSEVRVRGPRVRTFLTSSWRQV